MQLFSAFWPAQDTQIDLSLQRFLHSSNLSSDAEKKEITEACFNEKEDVLKSMKVV